MSAVAPPKPTHALPRIVAWFPLATLPVVVGLLAGGWPRWAFMWALAVAIYGGLKWLTLVDALAERQASFGRATGYLLLWPGMNAAAFLDPNRVAEPPRRIEWWAATAKLGLGVLSVFVAAPLVAGSSPSLAGWFGMTGVVLGLHFGLFHLFSNAWRTAGVVAPPLMQAPARSTSLAEFWGRRWNVAFRDVAHAYVFRPLLRRAGAGGATLAVFLVSGIVHDAVISIPAGAGHGLPTVYFLLQAAGVLFERTRLGRRLGLGRGIRGRTFCAAVLIAPLGLLFHRPFVERVVLPMLSAIGVL